MLDVPQDARHLDTRLLRFESATKRYYLHFIPSEAEGPRDRQFADPLVAPKDAGGKQAAGKEGDGGGKGAAAGKRAGGSKGAGAGAVTAARGSAGARAAHYGGTAPLEALYEGFFLELGAAKQYCTLYKGETRWDWRVGHRAARSTGAAAL